MYKDGNKRDKSATIGILAVIPFRWDNADIRIIFPSLRSNPKTVYLQISCSLIGKYVPWVIWANLISKIERDSLKSVGWFSPTVWLHVCSSIFIRLLSLLDLEPWPLLQYLCTTHNILWVSHKSFDTKVEHQLTESSKPSRSSCKIRSIYHTHAFINNQQLLNGSASAGE